MTRRLNIVLAAALLFFALPYYWMLVDNRPGDPRPRDVSMAELRALASSVPGPRPESIAVERTAFRLLPGNFLAAGSGMKRRLYSVLAYRLEVPGRGPVVIDPGPSKADAARLQMHWANGATQRRIDAALRSASLVLVTSPDPAVVGRLAARNRPLRIASDRPRAIAPGIVAIPTASPFPGCQMIYVRLANGVEYLLAGEVAPLSVSYRQMRGRPRLMTEHIRPEDREAAFAWLATIRELQRQAPGLRVLPGHDLAWMASPGQRDWLGKKFPDY